MAAEESLLKTAPDTDRGGHRRRAVLRFQVARLKKIGRNEEAIAAIGQLVRLEKGDPDTLVELVQWLIDQKAWQAVNELAERFGPLIADNSALSYAMAEAQLARGDKGRAEETAAKAWKLNPRRGRAGVDQPLFAGCRAARAGVVRLGCAGVPPRHRRRRARPTRGVAGGDPPGRDESHDQGDNLAAAEVMEKATKSPAANVANMAVLRAAGLFLRLPLEKQGGPGQGLASSWRRPWLRTPPISTC